MIVKSFESTCKEYKNFQIWDVANMDDFMNGNAILNEVFLEHYKISYTKHKQNRSKIEDSDLKIMTNLLDKIGDKHFFIFTWHDNNHAVVVQMQNLKIMNWGIDISDIEKDHVYIVMMDKIEQHMLSH